MVEISQFTSLKTISWVLALITKISSLSQKVFCILEAFYQCGFYFLDCYRATAMLSAVYAVVVCLLCVSDTLRYCIKTAKRRITQRTPHDSPMNLVF